MFAPKQPTGPAYYAEYLPNIQSISLTISSLPSGSTFGVSSEGDALVVVQPDGKKLNIPIPGKYQPDETGIRISQDPKHAAQTTVRIPATSLSTLSSIPDGSPEGSGIMLPWSASHLTKDVQIACATCDAVVVPKQSISTWKDLPSEGWAEMMDLWHCHKPDEHHLHHEHDHGHAAGSNKGYAASSKLVAKKGTGFVDVLSFLLVEEDCVGIENLSFSDLEDEAEKAAPEPAEIVCINCDSMLGLADTQSNGIRLYKPFLSLVKPPAASSPAIKAASTPVNVRPFTTEKWLTCYLLSLIESTGVRKFTSAAGDYEVWIFSTELTYTSSTTPDPTSAMKVLFRSLPAASTSASSTASASASADADILNKENLHKDTLTLPSRLERRLLGTLERGSQKVLPVGLFMGWKVALLEKFVAEDLLR